MKTHRCYLLLLILWVFGGAGLQAQSPCLCLEPGDLPKPYDCNAISPAAMSTAVPYASPTVTMYLSDEPQSLDNVTGARYLASWIYGDGNFFFPPYNGSLAADLSSNQASYTYADAGVYNPAALLIEKKSNSIPPTPTFTRRVIEVLNGAGAAAPAFAPRLEANPRSADILPNGPARPFEHRTAFAVSAPKSQNHHGFYFFYNSKYQSADNFLANDKLHALDTVLLPHYIQDRNYTVAKTTDPGPIDELGAAMAGAIRRVYGHYVYVQATADEDKLMPPGFTEYRYFPVLRTTWSDTTLPDVRFMALAVGFISPEEEPASYSQEILGQLRDEMNQTFGDTLFSGFFINGSNDLIIRGLIDTTLVMLGSIDPNEIEIMQICPESDGSYRVKCRMQVCNKGYFEENNLPIYLTNLSGGLSNLSFSDPTMVDSVIYIDSLSAWRFIWKAAWGALPHPDLSPGEEYEPQCNDLYFEVKANWAGVQALRDGQGLRMCVTFENAMAKHPECSQNYPLPVQEVTFLHGYKCGDGDENPYCALLLLLGILLLLVLLHRWINHTWTFKNPPC